MIRLDRSSVPVVAVSHPGRKRKDNEDRYGVSSYRLSATGTEAVLLAVLSDGIGGHRAGEVAADMAVERISQVVAESDGQNPAGILTFAIQSASDAIRDQAGAVAEQAGMGATCACAWMIGERLYTATVGDSRVYLMRAGSIHRLSTDHTWIQEAIENGLLLPEEVSGHPNAHIIRRYLGSPVAPDVDLRMRISVEESNEQAEMNQGLTLATGDRVLLTSDGLTDLVSDAEIMEAYQRFPAEEASRVLIERANARGGHDNITLVTFQAPPPALAAERVRKTAAAGWRWVGIGCAGVLALALVVAGSFWLLQSGRQGGATPEATLTATLVIPGDATLDPAVQPTSVVTPSVPSATASPTVTQPSAPQGGPTLTPWPTNTITAP